MARLTRKNIKVFAENATNNGIFGSLQANDPTTTNDVEQIQSLPAWSNGWDDATMTSEELPPLEEFQGIQYVVSYEQAYLMQEGLPEWSTTVTYYKGSLVKKVTTTGFQIYNSLTDNNTGNLLSDTSNWKLVMDSDNLYAFDSAVVHKTGNETVGGVKTFSSSPIVPNGSGPTDAVNKGQLDTKANTTDVVTLTGEQTITGFKTFESNIFLKDAQGTIGTTTNQWARAIQFTDSTGARIARLEPRYVNATTLEMGMYASNGLENEAGIYVRNDGSTYAPASDANGSIVTTTGISKSENGFVKLGNGLIIQWGLNTNGDQVTFPTPFTANPKVSICGNNVSGNTETTSSAVGTVTTTGFKLLLSRGGWTAQWIAMGY